MNRLVHIASAALGVIALLLCIALIVLSTFNDRRERFLQARQQELTRGILGQEAQQISSQIIKDLQSGARFSPDLRRLLVHHGFELGPASPTGPRRDQTPPSDPNPGESQP